MLAKSNNMSIFVKIFFGKDQKWPDKINLGSQQAEIMTAQDHWRGDSRPAPRKAKQRPQDLFAH